MLDGHAGARTMKYRRPALGHMTPTRRETLKEGENASIGELADPEFVVSIISSSTGEDERAVSLCPLCSMNTDAGCMASGVKFGRGACPRFDPLRKDPAKQAGVLTTHLKLLRERGR